MLASMSERYYKLNSFIQVVQDLVKAYFTGDNKQHVGGKCYPTFASVVFGNKVYFYRQMIICPDLNVNYFQPRNRVCSYDSENRRNSKYSYLIYLFSILLLRLFFYADSDSLN